MIDSCVCAGNSPLILTASISSTGCSKPAKPRPPPESSLLLPPCLCPSEGVFPMACFYLVGLMAGQKGQTQGFMFLPTAGAELVLSRSTKLNQPNKSLNLPNEVISNCIPHVLSVQRSFCLGHSAFKPMRHLTGWG